MKTFPRKLAAMFLVLLLLAALSACGSTGSPSATPAQQPGGAQNTQPTAEPSQKDEVIIGFTSVPSNYDPLNGFTSGIQIMYSALLQTDTQMRVVPDLAADYSISEDALTYRFKLRDGARFSDGSTITAEDVVFSYETAMGNATSLDLSRVESVGIDNGDIVIRLRQPDSTFILTVTNVGIVPKASYGEDFALHPVSSGPYKLVQYDVDQQFILEANEYYYGGAPGIRRVVFVKMADQDTRLLAVQSGQVDITLTSAVAWATM